MYCLYRESSNLYPDHNLIEQVETKLFDYDNFSKVCFCNLTERALYAQVYGFTFEKERENINLELKEVKTGFLSLKDSIPSEDIAAFLIVDQARMEENKATTNTVRTRVYVPKAYFKI